ncbi:MAG: amidohydrolase family protein [Oscillibacter sp.]|nr:amidohydrolase family protein [Oscillibacter sp.]
MLIDIHTHTFPDRIAVCTIDKLQAASHTKPFTDGTAGALGASMLCAGVDWSVVLPVATNAGQVPRINDAAAQANEHAAETGILSFGCMHPNYPDWRGELDRLASLGFRGVKLHPPYQGVDFDDVRYVRILDRCGEQGLMVLIHAGLDVGLPGVDRASPAMVARAVRAAGPVTLILAHMGGWRQWEAVLDLLPRTGAYLDTSFSLGRMVPNGDGYYKTPSDLDLLSEERFLGLVRAFGADRVLFGTDCPWGGQGEEVEKIKKLPLTAAEREAVLGGNAEKLLHLPEREREA